MPKIAAVSSSLVLNHVCLHVKHLKGQEVANFEAQTFQECLCMVSVLP